MLLFFITGTTSGAAIYSFKDEQGNVHLTDSAPDDRYKLLLTTFKRPREFIRPMGTGSHYLDMIQNTAKQQGIPWTLLLSIIKTESNFDPKAVSPRGARGLMQLMPGVCRDYGVQDPFDIKENLRAGAGYFRKLFDRFKDIVLAMAAYNAGPGRVDQYNGVPPFKETRQYIKKILWYYEFYEKKGKLLTLPRSSALFDQGVQALEQGDLILAAGYFRKVAGQFPDSPETNYNLALIAESLGDWDQAINSYKKTLEVSPLF